MVHIRAVFINFAMACSFLACASARCHESALEADLVSTERLLRDFLLSELLEDGSDVVSVFFFLLPALILDEGPDSESDDSLLLLSDGDCLDELFSLS